MSSLDETFQELLGHLMSPSGMNPTAMDPFFYFVHRPNETFEIPRKLPAWRAALEGRGFSLKTISLAEVMWSLIHATGLFESWIELENSFERADVNESVRNALRENNSFGRRILDEVTSVSPGTVTFLFDTALLHPFFRARHFESVLHDKLRDPVVLFYPGRRKGQFGLQFLDFYPEDGNYRFTVVGGHA